MSGDHNMNQTSSAWRKRQIALNKKAENARELGLDYEPDKTVMDMAREAHINSKTWVDVYKDDITTGEVRGYLEAFAKLVREEQQTEVQRLIALVRAQQITIDKLEMALAQPAPVQEPVLQEIEQYRLQMAGISTAAIGYWKEGDGIHPDYDTPALRDVAKLYTQYDKLYKAQNVTHGVIAGALFDFMGWLTSRPKRIMLSSADEASPAVDAIKEFAKMRGLSLDDAKVQDWQDNTTPPQRT
jgi:hypothetical protein